MTAPEEPVKLPFTVIIDSAEGQPWSFQGIHADADKQYREWIVPTKRDSLGRHPLGLGDYSIEGFTKRIAVERKSIDDLWGTVLGWESDYDKQRHNAGRRERFEKELLNLSSIEVGLVVVEASLAQCIDEAPEWGVKSAAENRKSLHRSIISFEQKYTVRWCFCDTRRLAEVHTLQHFRMFHKHHKSEFRDRAKLLKNIPFI